MLGSGLAEASKVKVGDKIEIYGTEIPIAGIFDSADRFENLAVVMLLSDLQGFMNRPQEITGVLVRTDIPKDDKPGTQGPTGGVRKQIEALDKVIVVLPANQASATESSDKPAERATEGKVPAEVTISVDPALAAELRALDGMRAGLSTKFENVDEMGRRLLDRYHKPEEQGQIYYMLLQVHGQSGLQTPEHMIDYAQKALKFPLGSRQELMVYIYWGDVLNVRKTEEPWPKQRSEAAAVYLQGLKRVWQFHARSRRPSCPIHPRSTTRPTARSTKPAAGRWSGTWRCETRPISSRS